MTMIHFFIMIFRFCVILVVMETQRPMQYCLKSIFFVIIADSVAVQQCASAGRSIIYLIGLFHFSETVIQPSMTSQRALCDCPLSAKCFSRKLKPRACF